MPSQDIPAELADFTLKDDLKTSPVESEIESPDPGEKRGYRIRHM
jgi:hypothetical protein